MLQRENCSCSAERSGTFIARSDKLTALQFELFLAGKFAILSWLFRSHSKNVTTVFPFVARETNVRVLLNPI